MLTLLSFDKVKHFPFIFICKLLSSDMQQNMYVYLYAPYYAGKLISLIAQDITSQGELINGNL